MEGEEERSDKEGSFSKASIPKRIVIVLAGGLVNIVFGLVIYFILAFFVGGNISNIVESTVLDYGANIAGIQVGDEIVKIGNQKIRTKSDVNKILENQKNETLDVTIKREGKIQTIPVTPTEVKVNSTGIYLSATAKEEKATQIVQIEDGSSSQKAGLHVGDVIEKINDEAVIGSQQKIIEMINQKGLGVLLFTVERNGEKIKVEVSPDVIPTYYLGVNFKPAEDTFLNRIYYGFWNTADFSVSIIENLKMLFTGRVQANQLMGPVGISSVVAETQGFQDFISILALISLSLGVTNLLPFPPLDGGKIVILVIEAIRRKPLKENIEVGIQMAGFMLLIALSIYVTYNDILRIF